MIRTIVTVPDPRLRQKSKPVKKIDHQIKKLVQDLLDTVKTVKKVKGVGLSAVQIGQTVRVFVIEREGKIVEFINPRITKRSKSLFSQKLPAKQRFLEGCLSLPDYYASVDRHYQVSVEWQDVQNANHQEIFISKQAAYLQHEYDHLEGILFVDRVLAQKGKIYHTKKNDQGQEELVEVELG